MTHLEYTHTNTDLEKDIVAFHELNRLHPRELSVEEYNMLLYVQYSHIVRSSQHCMKQLELDLLNAGVDWDSVASSLNSKLKELT